MSCLCCEEYIELGCHNYCDTIEFEYSHESEDEEIDGSVEFNGNVQPITAELLPDKIRLDLKQLNEFGKQYLKFGNLCYVITTGYY